MEPRDRPHRATTTTSSAAGASELFICFTSRPTSTSSSAATTMRIPSAKSLMSPARTAAPSLSSSLSRRLRSSGSVKAGEQSPMFPAAVAAAAARKKGCSFEAAEPSSPKVTCIGQVRVKSKKKKNKCKATQGAAMARSRSQRRSGGEASFRIAGAGAGAGEGERECRPWGFCEALRSFGSEINCFAPCRGGRPSFCSSSKAGFEREEEKKRRTGSSCGGTVFGWMMAVEESEEGRGGEVVGLVVQENGRREVSLVVEKVEEEKEEKEVMEVDVEVVEESRASVCVPPKNALLLMRCRSDPVRMAALATRFWGSPAAAKVGAEEEEEEEEQQQQQQHNQQEEQDEEAAVHVEAVAEKEEEEQRQEEEEEEKGEVETAIDENEKNTEEKEGEEGGGEEKEEAKFEVVEENGEEEKSKDESFTESVDQPPLKEEKRRRSKAKEREMRRSRSSKEKERKRTSFSNEKEARRHSFSTERDVKRPSFSSAAMDTERRHSWSFSKKKSKEEEKEENPSKAMDSEKGCGKVEAGEKRELPDCLLLMMYEPKLSMEVSKETWVCSTDFLQWRPKEVAPAPGGAAVEEQTPDPAPPLSEEVEKKLVGTAEPAQVVAASAATAVQVATYEPFVLTRCKSEPMRSSARLAPDACFWKSRHQPIGAAGIGF